MDHYSPSYLTGTSKTKSTTLKTMRPESDTQSNLYLHQGRFSIRL